MENRVPLFYEQKPIGFVTVSEVGSRITLCAEGSAAVRGVARAYVCTDEKPQSELLIGVMEPVNGMMRASKTYTRNDLINFNVTAARISAGEVRSSLNIEWSLCKEPCGLFFDRALSSSLANSSEIFVEVGDFPKYVAAPLNSDAGFAFAPAFCLAKAIEINGITYGIIGRTLNGDPITAENVSEKF